MFSVFVIHSKCTFWILYTLQLSNYIYYFNYPNSLGMFQTKAQKSWSQSCSSLQYALELGLPDFTATKKGLFTYSFRKNTTSSTWKALHKNKQPTPLESCVHCGFKATIKILTKKMAKVKGSLNTKKVQ